MAALRNAFTHQGMEVVGRAWSLMTFKLNDKSCEAKAMFDFALVILDLARR